MAFSASTRECPFVASTSLATRMSSTRQKIYLCKSRNPKLSIDFDSLRFLFLCIVPLQLTAVENANQCLAFSTALLSALSVFNPTDSVCKLDKAKIRCVERLFSQNIAYCFKQWDEIGKVHLIKRCISFQN